MKQIAWQTSIYHGKIYPMKNPIEVFVEIKRETELAYLVSDGVNEFWLPKSQIEVELKKDDHAEITLPEWLAIEKGIV